MGVLLRAVMRWVILRRLLAYAIGCVYAVPVVSMVFVSLLRSRGAILRKKRHDKKPECLEDPEYGEHRLAQVKDVHIHYVVAGNEGKPLMVFVHGFPEFWFSWRHQIKEFKKNYRVVAIDQRGYNTSSKPLGVLNYTVDKLVDDVSQLITALGYNKCILVGHDWGGVTCWGVAMKYPDLVERLIIMNAPHPSTFLPYLSSTWTQFRKSWYMFLFQLPYLPEFLYRSDDMRSLNRIFLGRRAGVKSGKMSKEDVEAYKYVFSAKGSFTFPINYIRAMTRTRRIISADDQVTCPTLVLWGDADQFLDTGLIQLAAPYVPKLDVQIIKGASHWVQMDQPEAVNSHISDFLVRK
ncbi:epoxide hydrolase 1-like [Liolophura sinensis]|uniref:epoxide hydrolase 1-like n=1 Tax=Liolophura sinensis TaxID=3198878 RepID=UPI0031598841